MSGFIYNGIIQCMQTMKPSAAINASFQDETGVYPVHQANLYDIGTPVVLHKGKAARFTEVCATSYEKFPIPVYYQTADDSHNILMARSVNLLETSFPVTFDGGVVLGFPVIGGVGTTAQKAEPTTNDACWKSVPWCTGRMYYKPMHELSNVATGSEKIGMPYSAPLLLRVVTGKKPDGNFGCFLSATAGTAVAAVGDTNLDSPVVVMEAEFKLSNSFHTTAGSNVVKGYTLPFGGVFSNNGKRVLINAYIGFNTSSTFNFAWIYREQSNGGLVTNNGQRPGCYYHVPPAFDRDNDALRPHNNSTIGLTQINSTANDAPTI